MRPRALLAILLLPACSHDRSVDPVGDIVTSASPFAPVTLRVHPLTHVAQSEAGVPTLVCHVELKDRWSDTVKGVGQLQVALYRSAGGLDPGVEVQELQWNVELDNLDLNAALYDPATSTYRIPLGDLPDWIVALGQPGAGRATIRVVLHTRGPDGTEKFLRDEYVLAR